MCTKKKSLKKQCCCGKKTKQTKVRDWEDVLDEEDEDEELEEEDEDEDEELDEDEDEDFDEEDDDGFDDDEEELEDEELEDEEEEDIWDDNTCQTLTVGKWELQNILRQSIDLMDIGFFESGRVWLTTKQASLWYGVNERTIRKWISSGRVKHADVGSLQARYIIEVSLDERWNLPEA